MGIGAYPGTHAILVAVGPKPQEIERLRDLAESIAWHAPRAILVLVDDSPEPRDLARHLALPASLRVAVLHHVRPEKREFWRSVGICSVIMTGMRWIQANTEVPFVVKLDTDSLVIAPYAQRVFETFERHPKLGMVGAYRVEADGKPRDWSVHKGAIKALVRRFHWRHPRGSLRDWNDPLKGHVRAIFNAARRNGYRVGEHCLGGGYAVSRRLLDAMSEAGHLDDPMLWSLADLPEDVMIGLHTRAHGLAFADQAGRGGVFGVTYIGLGAPPAELLARDHAVIHAVKNDPHLSEAEIRAFFATRRTAVAA